jgi:hypothetical protein
VLHYCRWYSRLSILLSLSWVMIILILWLNWTNVNVQKSEKIEMWISRSVWWKSKLCSLGIIYNTTLFVFKIKYLIILSYWRTTYLCKPPVRFLWVHSCDFGNRFLIPIAMIFRATLHIWRCRRHHWSGGQGPAFEAIMISCFDFLKWCVDQ